MGLALLNTIAATATTAYLTAHVLPTPSVVADGTIAGFAAAYFWSGMFYVEGAVIAAVLFRTRADNAQRAAARAAGTGAGDGQSAPEPVVAH